MKDTRIKSLGVKPAALPKPFFLTSSLMSLLKRVAEEVAKAVPQPAPEPVLVRVKR